MNYEEDMKIDEQSLDIEWLEQPGLMFRYTKYAADIRLRADKAKENLDLVKADIDKDIRTNPEKYDIEKITETVVLNTIIGNVRYRKANEELSNAQYELNIANGAIRAIEARKDALENLGRLLGLQYFAGPKIPRNLSEEKESRQKKINSSITSKIRSRQKTN
jgi:hypothetical protein